MINPSNKDKKLIADTVDWLEHCKNAFMTDFEWPGHGIDQITDDLIGITHGNSNDYTSELFEKLSPLHRAEIQARLGRTTWINWPKVSATYYK